MDDSRYWPDNEWLDDNMSVICAFVEIIFAFVIFMCSRKMCLYTLINSAVHDRNLFVYFEICLCTPRNFELNMFVHSIGIYLYTIRICLRTPITSSKFYGNGSEVILSVHVHST